MMFEFLDIFMDIYYLQEVTDNDEIYLNAPNSVYRTMVAFIYLGLGKTIVTCVMFDFDVVFLVWPNFGTR